MRAILVKAPNVIFGKGVNLIFIFMVGGHASFGLIGKVYEQFDSHIFFELPFLVEIRNKLDRPNFRVKSYKKKVV